MRPVRGSSSTSTSGFRSFDTAFYALARAQDIADNELPGRRAGRGQFHRFYIQTELRPRIQPKLQI